MQTSGISATNTTQSNTDVAARPKTYDAAASLGEDAFMQLLLAQLKNQDPLKPMEDQDFIAQLAQFQSLNQLTEMSKTLDELIKAQSLSQGSALLGKTVSGMDDSGQVTSGVVSGLRLVGGEVMLDLGGPTMPLNSVHSVTQPEGSVTNGGQNQSIPGSTTG